ncbi:hypothetical protein QE152_g17978 [Popillia japonica]|uniref:Uncharacterized protein n=1 Tax=Popillia japonica TaxID=7064 RepID=A0AAW1L4U8_POPJA
MENLRPPREMSLEGDVVCNFRRWKQQFTIFMEASGAVDSTEMSNEGKVILLIVCSRTSEFATQHRCYCNGLASVRHYNYVHQYEERHGLLSLLPNTVATVMDLLA